MELESRAIAGVIHTEVRMHPGPLPNRALPAPAPLTGVPRGKDGQNGVTAFAKRKRPSFAGK